jgi:peptide/nickel transport system ATP-binding protein/oligopeptide transport system ATP-binding protein
MTVTTQALIRGEGLRKRYRARGATAEFTWAVDGVDLAVRKGETLGLVGESGCGKSTLGRLLLRLVEPTAGAVFYEGADLTTLGQRALRARRRDLQMIFQDPYGSLNPRKTAGAAIREAFAIHGLGTREERARWTARILERVGLPRDAADRYPHEFSGGQRQRIGIARALALQPKFVVCDESVSALDVSVQAQIISLMQDLQDELGLTYLFISHNLTVVRHISNRIAVMYLGRIVEVGDADLLFGDPIHPYTRLLFASTPARHPRKRNEERWLAEDTSASPPVPGGCRFAPRCPYAEPRCRALDPPLLEVAPGRTIACIRAADGTLPSRVETRSI